MATYDEFYIQAGGSYLNSGSTNSNAATYTSTNGNWNHASSTFTPTDGSNPVSAGVASGQYMSVYLNAAVSTVSIARIDSVTNASNGAIVLVPGTIAGTTPVTGSGTVSVRVGGAQKIPVGDLGATFGLGPLFYLDSPQSLSVYGSFNTTVRINCKNDAIYSVAHSTNQTATAGNMVLFQPYTSTLGDGGKVIVEGPTTGAAFNIWNTAAQVMVMDFEFRHNGATSFATALNISANSIFRRCVVHDIRGTGFTGGGSGDWFIECEAYNCNQSNTNTEGGFKATTAPVNFLRCISHDNNNFGFRLIQGDFMMHCISESNTGDGINQFFGSIVPTFISHCDVYNNGGDGFFGDVQGSGGSNLLVQNSNFVNNDGWGINAYGDTFLRCLSGFTDNLGFGSGTMANGDGDTTHMDHILANQGPAAADVTYPADVSPWVDAPNGDFRIAIDEAATTGYGYFYETQGGYTGSIAMPVIGAVQLPGPPVGTVVGGEVSAGYA